MNSWHSRCKVSHQIKWHFFLKPCFWIEIWCILKENLRMAPGFPGVRIAPNSSIQMKVHSFNDMKLPSINRNMNGSINGREKLPKLWFTNAADGLSCQILLVKDILSHLRTGKNTKSNKKIWEKWDEAKSKNNTRRLKQYSLSFNSIQTWTRWRQRSWGIWVGKNKQTNKNKIN